MEKIVEMSWEIKNKIRGRSRKVFLKRGIFLRDQLIRWRTTIIVVRK